MPVDSPFFTTFTIDSTDITGWKVVGQQVSVITSVSSFVGISFPAQNLNQWLDMSGELDFCGDCGVTQDISTIVGQAYNVEFYVGSVTNGINIFPSTVSLSIDGLAADSFTNDEEPISTTELQWKFFSKEFIATSSTTNLTFFNGFNPSVPNNLSALDNVSVVPVPGPLPLLGLGSAFVWSRRLRKRIKG